MFTASAESAVAAATEARYALARPTSALARALLALVAGALLARQPGELDHVERCPAGPEREARGFGRGGPHLCLGVHLARLEVKIVLAALARRVGTFSLAGEPRRIRSNFTNGLKRLPVRMTLT